MYYRILILGLCSSLMHGMHDNVLKETVAKIVCAHLKPNRSVEDPEMNQLLDDLKKKSYFGSSFDTAFLDHENKRYSVLLSKDRRECWVVNVWSLFQRETNDQ